MEDDKWWNPADEEEKSPKEEINDLLNEAEKKRLQRESFFCALCRYYI